MYGDREITYFLTLFLDGSETRNPTKHPISEVFQEIGLLKK